MQKRPGLRKLMPSQVEGAKEALIWALGAGQNVSGACRTVHVSRTTFYEWLQRDIAFAASVDEARGLDLRLVMDERWPERASTRSLIARLKALQPRKYGGAYW